MNFLNLVDHLSADDLENLEKHISNKVSQDFGNKENNLTVDFLIQKLDSGNVSATSIGILNSLLKTRRVKLESQLTKEQEENAEIERISKITTSKKFHSFIAKLSKVKNLINDFPVQFKGSLKLNLVFDATLRKDYRATWDAILDWHDALLCDLIPFSQLKIKVDNTDKGFSGEQVKALQQVIDENLTFENACDLAYAVLPELKEKAKSLPKDSNSLTKEFESFDIDFDVVENALLEFEKSE